MDRKDQWEQRSFLGVLGHKKKQCGREVEGKSEESELLVSVGRWAF